VGCCHCCFKNLLQSPCPGSDLSKLKCAAQRQTGASSTASCPSALTLQPCCTPAFTSQGRRKEAWQCKQSLSSTRPEGTSCSSSWQGSSLAKGPAMRCKRDQSRALQPALVTIDLLVSEKLHERTSTPIHAYYGCIGLCRGTRFVVRLVY
jgi:hypothetical protein